MYSHEFCAERADGLLWG